MCESYKLTMHDARVLGDILTGCERGNRLYWYPIGASGDAPHGSYVMRAITRDGGGFIEPSADVRSGHVWLSGIGELWLPVTDVMRALDNIIDGSHGTDQPMARIEDAVAYRVRDV